MEEILKKIPMIEIDTLSSKPIRIKTQVYLGDSILISLQLKENGEDKILHSGCTANILYSDLESKNVREQNTGITIEGTNISFVPNKLIVGVNKIELCIRDTDEVIYLCPLILNVLTTIDNNLIVDNSNDIQTLKQLKEHIDNTNDVLRNTELQLVSIGEKIEALTTDISEADSLIKDTLEELQIEVHETLVKANTKIDTELENIQNKIENKFNEFNNQFSKIIKLEAYLNNNNKVCFRSEFINIPAKELVNYSFIVHVNGSPYVASIQITNVGIITFSLESNGVNMWYNSLVTRSVQGNSLFIAPKFSLTNTNTISPTEFGFKIIIETTNGIASSLNNSSCCLAPLTIGRLL